MHHRQAENGHMVIEMNQRRAIHEKCLNCCAWYYSGVTDCTFEGQCPLWPFRSGQGNQNPAKRSRATRAYCRWCMAGSGRLVAQCDDKDCPLFPFRKTKIDHAANVALMTN